ncbi:glycosyltransferase family 2 protein [Candidatus Uhrbacteria bacterium]|nr:glycosyltransferase family 2 protein [Candidatus Uhrbacteria bacterium]
MKLSIIILDYKSRGLVRQCIKTINLFAPKCDYEVIVVDNDSGQGTGAMVRREFPDVVMIDNPANVGFAAGNNVGIRRAKGRYVLIMNPDITVRPGAIDDMMAYMEAHADIGVLGPRLVHPDGSIDMSCYRYPTPLIPAYRRTPLGKLPAGRKALSRYLMDDFDHRETREVDWLLGAVLLVRRSAIDKVGLLDERYFLYFEDTDWCRRFWKAGFRVVYYTGVEMVHYHERLSAKGSWVTGLFRKATRIHIASCIKYFQKWRAMETGPEHAPR